MSDLSSNKFEKTGMSRVLEESVLYRGRWAELVEMNYEDEEKCLRRWEGVHRKERAEAVVIVARLEPSGRFILIRQFRPPADAYVLEFPAGLIDSGEAPEATAVRELLEETGYNGEVESLSPRLFSSPGILSEAVYFAFMSVDENNPANRQPEANSEPEEFIEVFLKTPEKVSTFFNQEMECGVQFDVKLYTYFMAQGFLSV